MLLKRCIKGNMFCDPLVLTPAQRKDIERLHNEFRNNFIHFSLDGWSIEKAGLPRIVGVALDVVEQLMIGDQVLHLPDAHDRQARLTTALRTARDALHS